MLRIALKLLGQAHLDQATLAAAPALSSSLHHAHLQSTSRGAKRADARLDRGDARNQLFFRDEPNEVVLRRATPLQRGHHSGESRDFDKVTPFHRYPVPSVVAGLAIDRDFLLRVAIN